MATMRTHREQVAKVDALEAEVKQLRAKVTGLEKRLHARVKDLEEKLAAPPGAPADQQ